MSAERPAHPLSATLAKIIEAAALVTSKRGFDTQTLADIATTAGVPLGLLRYHFRSSEHLLIEAQRLTFRQVHARFEERFDRGEGGVSTALEALDALYGAVRDSHHLTPLMLRTLATAARDPQLAERRADFDAESSVRVELGLLRLFGDRLDKLLLPPERLALAVRTLIYGLVVELAAAQTQEDLARVDATYRDLRFLIEHAVLPEI